MSPKWTLLSVILKLLLRLLHYHGNQFGGRAKCGGMCSSQAHARRHMRTHTPLVFNSAHFHIPLMTLSETIISKLLKLDKAPFTLADCFITVSLHRAACSTKSFLVVTTWMQTLTLTSIFKSRFICNQFIQPSSGKNGKYCLKSRLEAYFLYHSPRFTSPSFTW